MGSKQVRPSTHFAGETNPLSGPMAPAELIHQQMVLASSNRSQGCSPPSIMPYGFRARKNLQRFFVFESIQSIYATETIASLIIDLNRGTL